ncbi:MAG: XdhC family protein [Hyphomicrobiaceae bacterium]
MQQTEKPVGTGPSHRDPVGPRDALVAAADWLERGERVALALVTSTWGSSPVPVGGAMAITADERFAGSVSGGCVENDVIVAAGSALGSGRAQLLRFGVANERAWAQGLPCGGEIEVLVVPVDGAGSDALLAAREALKARRPADLAIDLRTCALQAHTGAEVVGAAPAGVVALPSADAHSHLWRLRPPPRVVVVGATHTAQHLLAMLGTVGYDAMLVDPRSAYATEDRFPAIAGDGRTVVAWPAEATAAMRLDRHTALVALSHVADIDDEALLAALEAECFYVGALGSRRNHARRRERLAAKGAAIPALDRIHAPVGLDIGAHGPAEIAVAILAQIIAALRAVRASYGGAA